MPPKGGAASEAFSRIILHFDLDGFYAQVEQIQGGYPPTRPLVVVQWGMIIAMNYAAKDKGVNRLAAGPSVVSEAKKLCPDLVVVATELITKSASDVDDEDEMALFMDEEGNMVEAAPTKSMQKVSLKKYRDESVKIFKIILEHVQPKYFEKGGLDEVFVDATAMVDRRLSKVCEGGADDELVPFLGRDGGEEEEEDDLHCDDDRSTSASLLLRHKDMLCCDFDNVVIIDDEVVSNADFRKKQKVRGWKNSKGLDGSLLAHRRIYMAAKIAHEIRSAVYDKLMYTISVGVSHNKSLAKLASPMNKPNGVCVIPATIISPLMEIVPIKSLRSFGGKMGEDLERHGVSTCGEGRRLELADIKGCLGHLSDADNKKLYRIFRGICDEPVKEKILQESILSAKSFNAPLHKSDVFEWIPLMIREICDRVEDYNRQCEFFFNHRRWPQTLCVKFTRWNASKWGTQSKQQQIPPGTDFSVEGLSSIARDLMSNCADIYPLVRFEIQVSKFNQKQYMGAASIISHLKPKDTSSGSVSSSAVSTVSGRGKGSRVDEEYMCPVCEITIPSARDGERHVKEVHPDEYPLIYEWADTTLLAPKAPSKGSILSFLPAPKEYASQSAAPFLPSASTPLTPSELCCVCNQLFSISDIGEHFDSCFQSQVQQSSPLPQSTSTTLGKRKAEEGSLDRYFKTNK